MGLAQILGVVFQLTPRDMHGQNFPGTSKRNKPTCPRYSQLLYYI